MAKDEKNRNCGHWNSEESVSTLLRNQTQSTSTSFTLDSYISTRPRGHSWKRKKVGPNTDLTQRLFSARKLFHSGMNWMKALFQLILKTVSNKGYKMEAKQGWVSDWTLTRLANSSGQDSSLVRPITNTMHMLLFQTGVQPVLPL